MSNIICPPGMKLADLYDQSSFDEKFEVDVVTDKTKSFYHMEGKYYVPVLTGSFREMYEYACDYMIKDKDRGFREFMNPDTLIQRLKDAETYGLIRCETQMRLIDGSYRYVEYIGIGFEENGVPENKVYFYINDIQNKKDRLSGKLTANYYASNRNRTTGLLDGAAFIEAANNLYDKDLSPWCVIAIDIQHFKVFSAWFGTTKSTYVLSKIGSLLRDLELEERAVAAYYGQDSFGVFMPYDENKVNDLFKEIREIIYSYSNSVGFMPAFGVVVLKDVEEVPLDIYDQARIAVEEAKRNYTNNIKCFDSGQLNAKKEEYTILSGFKDALNNGEISFYLQPQCQLSTGKIIGAEALVRWQRNGEMISPGLFVPLLENGGFITELDKYIWEEVVKYQRYLLDKNITPLPISINVSRVDFLSMDVSAYLYVLCEHYRVSSRYLKVEVTESAYASDTDAISLAIDKLRDKGFKVMMDDFGSGYSSLNMLDKLSVDALKLDMVFMKSDISSNKRRVSIVESIVAMSKALEIPVIVEGVESEEQSKFLKNLGCRYAQGYLFYRPMKIEDYEKIIIDKTRVDYSDIRSNPSELFHTSEFLNENFFTDSMLNNILGAVAFYELKDKNLSIVRYNEPFYESIADELMESRLKNIQNYVVKEDHPILYRALDEAYNDAIKGSSCEIRFYKSNNSVFYFHMRFFYLRSDGNKKIYYGQVEDVSERREQSMRFLEVLRKQSAVTMKLNLDQGIIQYFVGNNTLLDINVKSISLDVSVKQTALNRISDVKDRKAFIDFFDSDRLRNAYNHAVYHEELDVNFRIYEKFEPVRFSSYYIRHSAEEDLVVYVFAKQQKTA